MMIWESGLLENYTMRRSIILVGVRRGGVGDQGAASCAHWDT